MLQNSGFPPIGNPTAFYCNVSHGAVYDRGPLTIKILYKTHRDAVVFGEVIRMHWCAIFF